MAERMRIMATMMDQMSGVMGKGMMMDGPMQKQINDIRMQLDQMMKPAAGGSKK
jgi:hypothetical protein